MDKNNFKSLSENLSGVIDRLVDVRGYGCEDLFTVEDGLQLKIDLLDRTIEILRIERRHLDNNLSMEEFVQGKIELSESRIKFTAPEKRKIMGSGTKPIALQPKLLRYLLYRHNNRYGSVYDIINNFIRMIWDHLELLDFKKTRTGVLRCFTNTRFAALTLRDYGLLRFTKKEAYKTWVLSLPGILVASKVMEGKNWEIPPVIQGEYHIDLHPDIRKAFTELQTYNKFVQRMTTVCDPNTNIFKVYQEGSKRSYSLMADYWQILQDSSISAIDRKKKSTAKLKQIEQDPEIKAFFNELSLCLKVGDLLNTK
jgi:hypothetical protein